LGLSIFDSITVLHNLELEIKNLKNKQNTEIKNLKNKQNTFSIF